MIDKSFLQSIGINPYGSVVINNRYKLAMECTYDELLHYEKGYLCFLLDLYEDSHISRKNNLTSEINKQCEKIALLEIAKGQT